MANGNIKTIFGMSQFLIKNRCNSAFSISYSPPLVQLNYSLNTFCSQPETNGLKKKTRVMSSSSEAKPKPIAGQLHLFSRALRPLHLITSSFDWFTALSVSFVIG